MSCTPLMAEPIQQASIANYREKQKPAAPKHCVVSQRSRNRHFVVGKQHEAEAGKIWGNSEGRDVAGDGENPGITPTRPAIIIIMMTG